VEKAQKGVVLVVGRRLCGLLLDLGEDGVWR